MHPKPDLAVRLTLRSRYTRLRACERDSDVRARALNLPDEPTAVFRTVKCMWINISTLYGMRP